MRESGWLRWVKKGVAEQCRSEVVLVTGEQFLLMLGTFSGLPFKTSWTDKRLESSSFPLYPPKRVLHLTQCSSRLNNMVEKSVTLMMQLCSFGSCSTASWWQGSSSSYIRFVLNSRIMESHVQVMYWVPLSASFASRSFFQFAFICWRNSLSPLPVAHTLRALIFLFKQTK